MVPPVRVDVLKAKSVVKPVIGGITHPTTTRLTAAIEIVETYDARLGGASANRKPVTDEVVGAAGHGVYVEAEFSRVREGCKSGGRSS